MVSISLGEKLESGLIVLGKARVVNVKAEIRNKSVRQKTRSNSLWLDGSSARWIIELMATDNLALEEWQEEA